MTITPEHRARMNAGRRRGVALRQAEEHARHDAFHSWIRREARLWRIYTAADPEDVQKAHDEWHACLGEMPELPDDAEESES